jgi:hypothetical protein
MRRRGALLTAGVICLFMSLVAVFGLEAGAVDEMDFWGGTLLLVMFADPGGDCLSLLFGTTGGGRVASGATIRCQVFPFWLRCDTVISVALLTAWLVTDFSKVIMWKGLTRRCRSASWG